MPQSIDAITESPHPTPIFVASSVPAELLRPVVSLYRQGSSDAAANPPCHCKLDLSIGLVEEQDPTVTLEVRWFVDYESNDPIRRRVRDSETLLGDFNTTSTIRRLAKAFNFDPDIFGITTNGTHTIDVVVAEAAAFASPSGSAADGKALISSDYNRSEYRFVVNVQVDADPVRPTCPSSPPSIRVCQ